MEFVCYRDLASLPAGTAALFDTAAGRHLFLSREWFESLLEHEAAEGGELCLASVVAGDRLLALLPLVDAGDGSLHALSHSYASSYSVLVSPQMRTQALACLAAGLARLPVTSLMLAPVGDEDDDMAALLRALTAEGFDCQRHFRFYNWVCRVGDGGFDGYLQARPSQLRNTLRRKRRKLEKLQNSEIGLLSGHAVPEAMADYHAVFEGSWKAREQHRELLDALVARFSARGWSRLGMIRIDGRPVAAQLWFVVAQKAYIFRLAYDEAWRQYSPGTVLTAHLMAHVIDTDGVAEVDFLVGNEAYKQAWMSERRERAALLCVRPGTKRTSPLARLRRWIGAAD